MLHFQAIVRLGAGGMAAKVRKMNEDEYIDELSTQAASLARNISYRYRALGRAYLWLSLSVGCFILGSVLVVGHLYLHNALHSTPHPQVTPSSLVSPSRHSG